MGQCSVNSDPLANRKKSEPTESSPPKVHKSLIPHSPSSSPRPRSFSGPDFYLLMTLSFLLQPFIYWRCPLKHRDKSTTSSRTRIWLLMNLQIVSHVSTHFICFPGNIAIGPFENTLRGRDSPSLDRRILHKAEVGMTDNELLLPSPLFISNFIPSYFY